MTLHDLLNNQSAIILYCLNKRLCDIGICPGVEVWMTQSGNLCIISIDKVSF